VMFQVRSLYYLKFSLVLATLLLINSAEALMLPFQSPSMCIFCTSIKEPEDFILGEVVGLMH